MSLLLTFVPSNYISESGSSGSEIAFPPRAGNQDSEFEKGDVGGSEGDSSEVHSTDGSDSAYPREDEVSFQPSHSKSWEVAADAG